MRRSWARWLLLASLVVAPGASGAAEITDLASSGEPGHAFDLRLRVGYDYFSKTAAIKREHEGDPAQDKVAVLKDLVYGQSRHTMHLRAEVGLWRDLSLSVGLPLVLSDERSYAYDQRLGNACVYGSQDANCVNASNSLTTNPDAPAGTAAADLASYTIVPAGGFDAQGNGQSFAPGSTQVFRGPRRGGSGADVLDTVDFGLSYAIFNQRRRDTEPTWVISAEYRLSVGNVMKFDRAHPDANHGVADGLDHFAVRTSISRRFHFVEPYTQVWFDYPWVRRDDTLFVDYGPNQKISIPQISGGVVFGLELVAYDKPADHYKVAFDVAARITGKFDGRGYSEAWEMLASSPALACDATWNPSCSPASVDPVSKQAWNGTTPYQGRAFTGLTTIQNYASIGAQLALTAQLTKWFRARAALNYVRDQGHLITIDDVGKPGANDTRVTRPSEYNPAYRAIINEVGRRYVADGVDNVSFGLYGQAMF